MQHFAQPSAPARVRGKPGGAEKPLVAEEAALQGPCDVPRYRPSEVDTPERIIRVMALGEPFIISDVKAPDVSSSAPSAPAKANRHWQLQGPSALSVPLLKGVLGPRRLVAPQCTLANGTSFSNYKGNDPEKRGESFTSSTCEMAWEHLVDGVFLEKPLPVAARYLEGGKGGEDGDLGEAERGSEDEAIVRRVVKLQKRLRFPDVMHMVKPILEGLPQHVWGGWDFVDSTASLLFMASRETRTPLHKDGFNAMIVQLNGTKHWTLIPDEVKRHIREITGPENDVRQRRGPLDLQEPLRSKLKARCCLLQPVEILYVPGNYWHDVYSLTAGASLSVRLNRVFEQLLQQQRGLR